MRKLTQWVVAGAAGLSAAALLAGCGSTAPGAQSVAPPNNTVVVAINGTPNFWFPMNSAPDFTELNGEMNHLMYLPLVNVSHADAVSFQQAVADRVVSNANGTVYTVYLNPRVKWSNGQPVTSSDVVFAWDVMDAASQTSPAPPWYYGGAGMGGVPTRWKSVVADGPEKVVVTLNEPTNPAWFEHNGLTQIFPMPASVWNRDPGNMTKELQFIASVANDPSNPVYRVVDGPYQFSKTTDNEYWDFVPNPHYYGQKGTFKVVFQELTSSSAEFTALEKGEIQVGTLPFSLYASRKQLAGDHLRVIYPFGFNYLTPNENPHAAQVNGAFALTYVRQAMEMGINQPAIVRALYHGLATPEYDQVPPEPPTVFDDPHVPALTYNPSQGEKLLEAHGWTLKNGVMTKGAMRLKFTLLYPSGSITYENEMEYLASTWAKEGIQVKLKSESGGTIFALATQSSPGTWAMANTIGWIYGPDFYPTGGEFFLPESGANNEGYDNAHMTQLIEDTYLPGTPTQQQTRFDQFLAYEAQQVPVLWIPYTPELFEISNGIKGFVASYNPITGFYYPNEWRASP
jgi:peptide/nickel transport system substrate-binding protein